MIEIKKRLLSQINKTNSCWEWKGVISKGYGLIKVQSKSTRVHRIMYELFVKKIPLGYVIDHLCKNKKCVNPNHLEAVTHKENTLRGNSPPAINYKMNKCKRGHEFTIIFHKGRENGRRICKFCQHERRIRK